MFLFDWSFQSDLCLLDRFFQSDFGFVRLTFQSNKPVETMLNLTGDLAWSFARSASLTDDHARSSVRWLVLSIDFSIEHRQSNVRLFVWKINRICPTGNINRILVCFDWKITRTRLILESARLTFSIDVFSSIDLFSSLFVDSYFLLLFIQASHAHSVCSLLGVAICSDLGRS